MLVSDKSFVIKATVHRQIEAGFEKEFPVPLQSDKLTDKLVSVKSILLKATVK